MWQVRHIKMLIAEHDYCKVSLGLVTVLLKFFHAMMPVLPVLKAFQRHSNWNVHQSCYLWTECSFSLTYASSQCCFRQFSGTWNWSHNCRPSLEICSICSNTLLPWHFVLWGSVLIIDKSLALWWWGYGMDRHNLRTMTIGVFLFCFVFFIEGKWNALEYHQ